MQACDEGEKRVAYASPSLLEHEKKWTTIELEAAALIWALETFRPYIDGVHVAIRTDHAPLECIRSKTDRYKRLRKWALRLQEFRFAIQPRPGTSQKHVDAPLGAPIHVESTQRPIVLDEFPERVFWLVRSWDERVIPLLTPLGPGTSDALAARPHPARLCSALGRRRTPNAEDSAASESPRDTVGTFNGPALMSIRNPKTTGVRWCSPVPKKVTMLKQLWWCRAERRTSLR